MMSSSAVGFSDLPPNALDEIARRAGPLDNVVCSAVCRSWRRALAITRLRQLGRKPGGPHRICISRSWSKKQPSVVKVRPYSDYQLRQVETVVDEEAARTRIIGCGYGWAVTVDDDTWAMSLLDPLTGRRFLLPPFPDFLPGKERRQIHNHNGESSRFWRHKIRKAALAPGRRLGTYAVMLLHSNGRGLSYLGPGATAWATLRLPRGMPHKYLDAMFHGGAFYTVSCYAELNAWAPDGAGGLRARRLTSPKKEQVVWAILTESMSRDGILMVTRTEPQGPSTAKNNSHYFGRRGEGDYDEVRRYAEAERAWLPVKKPEQMTILVGKDEGCCSLCVPRRSNGFQNDTSHWFFPYVPRLPPALW